MAVRLALLIALCAAVQRGATARETRLTDADIARLDAELDEEDERAEAAQRPAADVGARAEMVFAMLHYRGMALKASERLTSQWSVQLQSAGISAGAHTISTQRLVFTLRDGRYVRDLIAFLLEQPETAAVMHDGVEQSGPADSDAYREGLAAQAAVSDADAARGPVPPAAAAAEGAAGSDDAVRAGKRRRRSKARARGKDEV